MPPTNEILFCVFSVSAWLSDRFVTVRRGDKLSFTTLATKTIVSHGYFLHVFFNLLFVMYIVSCFLNKNLFLFARVFYFIIKEIYVKVSKVYDVFVIVYCRNLYCLKIRNLKEPNFLATYRREISSVPSNFLK